MMSDSDTPRTDAMLIKRRDGMKPASWWTPERREICERLKENERARMFLSDEEVDVLRHSQTVSYCKTVKHFSLCERTERPEGIYRIAPDFQPPDECEQSDTPRGHDAPARCLGYTCGNPTDGYDYDCEHEFSGDISCEECRFGPLNPLGIDPRFPLDKQPKEHTDA